MGMFIQYVIFLYMLTFGTNPIQGYSSKINYRKLEFVEGKLNIFIKELEFVKEDLKDEREKYSNLEKRLDTLMNAGKGISVDIKDSKKEVHTVQNHHEERVNNPFYDEIQEKVNMEMKITTLNETLTAHIETKLKTLEDEVLHSVTGLNDYIASIKELTSNVKQNKNSITHVKLESEQQNQTLLRHDAMLVSFSDSLVDVEASLVKINDSCHDKVSKKEVNTVQHHHEQRVYNALFDEKQERKVFENYVKSVLKDEKVNMEIKFTTLNETLTSHIETQLNTLEDEVLHSVTGLNDSIASIKELTSNEIVNMEMKFTTLNETLTSHIETQLNTLEGEVLHSVTGLNDSIEYIKELTSNEKVNIEMKFTTLNETLSAHIDTKLKTLEDEVLHSVTGLNDSIESIKELTSNVKQNENYITHVKLESEQQNTTLLRHDAILVSFSDSLVDVEASLVELNHSCHDKGWSGWSRWGTCSKSCGVGLQISTRTCSSTETPLSGKCCVGSDTQTQICTLSSCPVWSRWSSWSSCSSSCGVCQQKSTRTCSSADTPLSGSSCIGLDTKTQACTSPSCADAKDCLDVLNQNKNNVNGVCKIRSPSSGLVHPVYCDMTTDGGGWTVFQKRFDGSVDFYRTFKEYEDGFGDVNAEFWMGLKHVHDMTSTHTTELRIHLTAGDGSTAYQTFQDFSVSPGPDYKLRVGQSAGTAGDDYGLTYANGSRFSTKDKDVDVYSGDCAEELHGGWWYKSCSWVNLNGHYATPGTRSLYHSGYGGVMYYSFKPKQSLKTTTMMFRRK